MQLFNKSTFRSDNLDSYGNLFFGSQLEYIQAQIYEYQYAPLKAFELIPINYNIPAGAKFVSATGYQSVGRARIINNYADDLPEASVLGQKLTNPVISLGCSYRYSYDDIRSAQYGNVPLSSALGISARKANDQLVNDLAINGSVDSGLLGWLNNPNIPSNAVPADGVGASTLWVNKTPDQILRDMNLIVNGIVVNTNDVERPDSLALPLEQYTYIASTPRSANSDTTILDYFKMNNPYVKNVYSMQNLAGAGPAGVDIMIAFTKDPTKFEMQIAMPFTQYGPQERNLEFIINCESRFGGVQVYLPLSQNIGEGI